MSGILTAILGTALGRLTGNSGSVVNTSVSTGIRSGTFALVNDGTFTGTGTGGGSWFTPTIAAIGSGWSAKLAITTQANTTISGTTGSFVSLTSGASWSFQNTATNNEGTGTGTISFSPDGGTTTAGTMSFSWDVGFAP